MGLSPCASSRALKFQLYTNQCGHRLHSPRHRVYKAAHTAVRPPFSFSTDRLDENEYRREDSIGWKRGRRAATKNTLFRATRAATGARPFSGSSCSSCPGSLAPGDRHLVCFRCLGVEHAAAAMANPASCAACQPLPEEEILSRHTFRLRWSFPRALTASRPDLEEEDISVDDDDYEARGILRLEPPLAALLCPGAGCRPNEKPLPPDRLQRQIVGLTDKVFVCASQSVVAVNNIALLSSALAGREAYGPEEAARWLGVSPFPAPSYNCAS